MFSIEPVDEDERAKLEKNLKEYFSKLYRRNRVKRKHANSVLFRKNVLEDQFDYFLRAMTMRQLQHWDEIPSENGGMLSQKFTAANKLLPKELFSPTRFQEYDTVLTKQDEGE